jgi:predicted O-methyltransferase YrrM
MLSTRFVAAMLAALLVIAAAPAFAQDRQQPPALERPPQAKDDAEQKILDVAAKVDKEMGVPEADGRLLRILTESIGAKHVVELGTSTGYSGLWFAMALRKTNGKLTTFDIDPRRIKIAKENFKQAGVDNLITVIEGDAHEKVKELKGEIDLVFIDADKEGYLDYLNKLLPLVRPGGLIVAHNMNRPRPDPKFVEAITTNKDLDTVFLNMHAAGVSVSVKKR